MYLEELRLCHGQFLNSDVLMLTEGLRQNRQLKVLLLPGESQRPVLELIHLRPQLTVFHCWNNVRQSHGCHRGTSPAPCGISRWEEGRLAPPDWHCS